MGAFAAVKSPDFKSNALTLNKSNILRWSGSKAKLIPELLRCRPPKYAGYVEPFAGSACLYFSLNPTRAVLGDINPNVMAVYRAISEDPHAVSDALDSVPATSEAYYILRALDPNALTLAQRAARLIFLMKSCFNGVYRTNRQGLFNVPMGNRIYALPSRERLVATQRLLRQTQLIEGGYLETLEHSQCGDWVYMDPPYRKQGRFRGEYGYSAKFTDSALDGLIVRAEEMASTGRHVMLSYSYDEELLDALPKWKSHVVTTVRTVASAAGARRMATELILTSYCP